MLISLHVENVAVIKSIDVDFTHGFCALTGQTGAGKSIIIDSIKLLLGAKGERELIRHGEDFCFVSGLFGGFTADDLKYFEALGIFPDEEGTILLQRRLMADGRSQIRVNGRAVSISVLKSLCRGLVNIHGQADTHALTDPSTHINILDTYAGVSDILSEYKLAYAEYVRITNEIKSITEKEAERERLVEMYEYQINDISSLSLKAGEEEELIDKKLKLKNSERITKQAGFVFRALKGSEKGSACYLIDRCISQLEQLSDVIPAFDGYAQTLRDILYKVDDISEEVYASLDGLDEDPTERLNEIESRLDKISRLKRKYGPTVEDILAFLENISGEVDKLKNSSDLLLKLNTEQRDAYNKAVLLADKLHEARAEAKGTLEGRVLETLEFLDMPKVVFLTQLKVENDGEKKRLSPLGYDTVEFFISANKGAEPKPLAKIASGGELARIMLSLKNVIADKDGVRTIIFDEIDAGVSGKTARKIGIKLLELSRGVQVVSVTHSAQIASLADLHLLITKQDAGDSTQTEVSELDDEGRVAELSRILGGINITDAQRAAAYDMLKEREIYKK